MKNVKVNILLALFAIVGLSLSCTTDSDSGSGSGGNSRQRVVSKIVFECVSEDWVDEYAFKYDSYGRITRVTHGFNDEFSPIQYYKYGSGNDLLIEDGEEEYAATLNSNGYLSEKYYEDGVYDSYIYDSKGHLIRMVFNGEYDDDSWKATYSWSGGNIVVWSEEDDYEVWETRLSYNNKSMDVVNLDLNVAIGGWFSGGLVINVCEWYWGDGLCGQKSKNFMTGWVSEDEEVSLKWSYDKDGYPVEVIVTDENGDNDEYRVSIIYKS